MLGNTVDVTHETLNAGVDLHEFAPLPGLALAARTLLEIWDGLSMVNVRYYIMKSFFILLISIS